MAGNCIKPHGVRKDLKAENLRDLADSYLKEVFKSQRELIEYMYTHHRGGEHSLAALPKS